MNAAPAPVEHPSPRRRRVGWLAQLLGLFGAPTAWAFQMSMSEILSSRACYPYAAPLPHSALPWLHPAIIAISVLCFLAALFCAWLAWRAWRRTRHEAEGEETQTVEIGEGRTRFLALLGFYSTFLFLIAIAFTAFAIVLVSPC